MINQIKNIYLSSRPYFTEYLNENKVSSSTLDQKISISLDHKFVYYRIPKAANSTIFNSLYVNTTGKNIESMESMSLLKENHFFRARNIKKEQLKEIDQFIHFTFVRHPVDRFLSCFKDKIEGGEKASYINNWLKRGVNEMVTMPEFIAYLEAGGLYENAHWAPQSELIPSDINKLNFIGKVETIEKDWLSLTETLSVNWSLTYFAPHSTSNKKNSQKQVIDDSSLKRIKDLYKNDFKTFGYKY